MVNPKAPATPAARATATSSRPGLVLGASSGAEGSTGRKNPKARESPLARATPKSKVLKALRKRSRSPRAEPRAKAMAGPSRGAITMAPMTKAALPFTRPTAATRVARATRAR